LNAVSQRITIDKISSLAHEIWRDSPKIAEKTASEASRIIQLASERTPTFFSGKSAKGILGGLFYHLSHRYNNVKTQKEIARCLGTTEMTVRASSRDWQEQFPDLIKHK
jgi:transcription initiation factor TFIIIB Brf1 subunit/transcription initiation factor TFIIB